MTFFLQMMVVFFWHAYRFLTLRPSLSRISDTKFTLVTFVLLYFVVGVLRHSGVFGGYGDATWRGDHFFWIGFVFMALGLITVFAVFALFFIQKEQSKVLFMGILFCCTCIDLVSILAQLASFPATVEVVLVAFELFMYFIVIKTFKALPDEMQKAGYRVPQAGVTP